MSISDKEAVDQHPSYGIIRFSRHNGDPGRLFGSALQRQGSFVRMTVTEGECIHHLAYDRYHGKRDLLLEVDLSSAQFAELLTTMNHGDGVPCTLRSLQGKRIPPPPADRRVETEKVRDSFRAGLSDLVQSMRQQRERLKDLLAKKTIGVADRAEICSMIERLHMEVESNVPFVLDQFEEAAERVITHAKAEVESFTTQAVMSAGLKALARDDADELPQLQDSTPQRGAP